MEPIAEAEDPWLPAGVCRARPERERWLAGWTGLTEEEWYALMFEQYVRPVHRPLSPRSSALKLYRAGQHMQDTSRLLCTKKPYFRPVKLPGCAVRMTCPPWFQCDWCNCVMWPCRCSHESGNVTNPRRIPRGPTRDDAKGGISFFAKLFRAAADGCFCDLKAPGPNFCPADRLDFMCGRGRGLDFETRRRIRMLAEAEQRRDGLFEEEVEINKVRRRASYVAGRSKDFRSVGVQAYTELDDNTLVEGKYERILIPRRYNPRRRAPAEPHLIRPREKKHREARPHEGKPGETPLHEAEPHATRLHEGEPHATRPHEAAPHEGEPHARRLREGEPHRTRPHEAAPHEGEPHATRLLEGEPHGTRPHEAEPRETKPHESRRREARRRGKRPRETPPALTSSSLPAITPDAAEVGPTGIPVGPLTATNEPVGAAGPIGHTGPQFTPTSETIGPTSPEFTPESSPAGPTSPRFTPEGDSVGLTSPEFTPHGGPGGRTSPRLPEGGPNETTSPLFTPAGGPDGPTSPLFTPAGGTDGPTSPLFTPDSGPDGPTSPRFTAEGRPVAGPTSSKLTSEGRPVVGPTVSRFTPEGRPIAGPTSSRLTSEGHPVVGSTSSRFTPEGRPVVGPTSSRLTSEGRPVVGPTSSRFTPEGRPVVGPTRSRFTPEGRTIVGPTSDRFTSEDGPADSTRPRFTPKGGPVTPVKRRFTPYSSPVGPTSPPYTTKDRASADPTKLQPTRTSDPTRTSTTIDGMPARGSMDSAMDKAKAALAPIFPGKKVLPQRVVSFHSKDSMTVDGQPPDATMCDLTGTRLRLRREDSAKSIKPVKSGVVNKLLRLFKWD